MSSPRQGRRGQKRYIKELHKAGKINHKKKKPKYVIVIPSSSVIGIHKCSVIRRKGGGKMPLDDILERDPRAQVKCIGIRHSGWSLFKPKEREHGAFIEHGHNYGTILPAYGSREGVNRHVIAIIRDRPGVKAGSRVYKFPLFGWTASNIPEIARKNKEIATKIHKILPENSAKFINIHKIPELEFEEHNPFSEGILVEEHEFIGSGHSRDGKIISKNLAEETFDHPDELVDAVRQISTSVTKLFNRKILFTDTKAENFVRDYKKDSEHPFGHVKIVDHEAEYLPEERKNDYKEEQARISAIKRFGRALAVPVNELSERNSHLFSKDPNLKKKIEHAALDPIVKNLHNHYARERIIKYFHRNLKIRRI